MDYELLRKLVELLNLADEDRIKALELILSSEKKSLAAVKEMMEELDD